MTVSDMTKVRQHAHGPAVTRTEFLSTGPKLFLLHLAAVGSPFPVSPAHPPPTSHQQELATKTLSLIKQESISHSSSSLAVYAGGSPLPLVGQQFPHFHRYIWDLMKSKPSLYLLVCDVATEKVIEKEKEIEKDSDMVTETRIDQDREPERPRKT